MVMNPMVDQVKNHQLNQLKSSNKKTLIESQKTKQKNTFQSPIKKNFDTGIQVAKFMEIILGT